MAYLNEMLEVNGGALAQFRNRVKDVLPNIKNDFSRSDICLFKFLVAREFDMDKAEDMLRKNLEWRKENKIDFIHSIPPPQHVVNIIPVYLTGKDKRGCPVIYHPVGKWKGYQIIKKGWKQDGKTVLFQGCESVLEGCAQATLDTGSPVCQYYAIYDMKGFDFTQLMSIELTKFCQDVGYEYLNNYPEIISYIRVINAPKLFQLVWAIVEPMLTGRIMAKIEIYGSNSDGWKEKLLEEVGEENLPSCIGGAITTCFPYRREMGVGPVAFPKYDTLSDKDFKQVFITAGQKYSEEYELKRGMQLVWNFKSFVYDVGFEVRFAAKETLVEYCRVDSHRIVQKGLINCEEAGKYSLIFDNSYSKMRGKQLELAVIAREPL